MYAQNKTGSCILAAISLFHSMLQASKHISSVVVLQYGKHGDNLSDSIRTRVLVLLGPELSDMALRRTRWQTRHGKRTNGLHFDAFMGRKLALQYRRHTAPSLPLFFASEIMPLTGHFCCAPRSGAQPDNTSSKRKR
jgi:hypothetical protein